LIDQGLARGQGSGLNWKLLLPMIVFMVADFLAVIPVIGPSLRDLGASLLSLIYLMWAGVMVLTRWKDTQNQASATV
jgi:hypothetical protein